MKIVLAAVALTALGACATVTKGTEDTVRFQSQPSSADVTFEETRGKLADQSCVTPCTIELNRKWTYNVTFEKDGYKPVSRLLEPKLSGDGAAGMAGNVLLGGVIGAAVDGSTGAMNDLKPNPMIAMLELEDSDTESRIYGEKELEEIQEMGEEAAEDKMEDMEEAAEGAVS